MSQSVQDAAARRAALEQLFLSNLAVIEAAIRYVARSRRLNHAEAEDFASETKIALIKDDYAILSRFEGRCSLKAFLMTVIQRLFIDHRRKLWGKWRPSAQARRLGATAEQLEVLLYRDGLTLDQACETLQTNRHCNESRLELAAIAHRLPARERRIFESLDGPQGSDHVAGTTQDQETTLHESAIASRCQAAIWTVMAALAAEDRVILKMRFEDDRSVADIARLLDLDQRALYRRVERLLLEFRQAIDASNVTWQEVESMIEHGRCSVRLDAIELGEEMASRPSSPVMGPELGH